MTLPPSQQHALNAIDDVLQSAEPRLATMFGVFTDLTRMEAMPAAETLAPGPWWARWTRHRLPGHLARRSRARRFRAGRPGRPGSGRRPGGQAGRAGRQLSRIVLIPVLLLVAAGLLVVSLVSSGAAGRRGCGHAAAAVMLPGLGGVATGTSGSGRAACPAGSPQPTARSG
jgi:hypothetical protein